MKIKYVNAPKKPDGKFGNIKMETGETFFVNVGCLPQYAVGMDITPPFENKKWGDSVVQVIPPHYNPAANGNVQQPAAVAPAAPAPQQSAPQQSARMTDPKDVMIFVTGVVGRAMGSGQFGVTDIDLLTKAALTAYKANLA